MPYYRKKPIPVEARQYTGDNFLELQDWSSDHVELSDYRDDAICVYTPEGLLWFNEGDYVIKGAHGEFYPCRKDIFEETYEEIDKHHDSFIVRPTLAKNLRPGDLFRNDSQSFQIKEVERTGNVVEISYSFEGEHLVNSFYLSPDDTLDLVIGTRE